MVVSLLVASSVSFAQVSKSDESLEFRPHWDLGVQGGASYTFGEAKFFELLSPAAQISATYNFHNAMGVRVGLSGYQGKGAVVVAEEIYRFRYAQLNADYVLRFANLFGGFDHARIFDPYVFAGIGGAYGFNNKEAASLQPAHNITLSGCWDNKFFLVGRAGVGADFWVSEDVAIGVEVNANCYNDDFNSKQSTHKFSPDIQPTFLVGAKFRLGANTAPSVAYVAAQEAKAAAQAAAEAEKLAKEKAEAARRAAAQAEAQKLAAEKAAAEKAAKEKAAAEKAAQRAAIAAENSEEIFFDLNSSVIRVAESAKLEKFAEWMKANSDFTVALVGYADKKTGNPSINLRVSESRVNAVKAKLVSLGVSPDRIITDFKGDSVQIYSENVKNRVVTCALQ